MQTSLEKLDPSSSTDFKYTEELDKINIFICSDSDEEENNDDDDDFTFACAADDDDMSFFVEEMFDNGKIKQIFPLFDQSLVFTEDLPHMPPVKNIFLEACDAPPPPTAAEKNDETAGPTCSWRSRQAVEVVSAASPESCKKSNSTGFSKIWRFKEMSHRSHSDGRDTFVFLNKLTPKKKLKDHVATDRLASEKKLKDSDAAASVKTAGSDVKDALEFLKQLALEKKPKDPAVVAARKTTGSDGSAMRAAATMTAKKKGRGKGKTVASAHEVYVKSRAATREEDKRRSYLPYKPELVGFFTNVHGGMSKNVHPF